MAFRLVGALDPHGGPLLRSDILKNSQAFTELDSVKFASGFIAPNTAAALTYGHILSLITNLGVGLNTTGAAGAAIGSFVGTYTTASDNQTVGMVRATINITKHALYSVTPDAAVGTTTGSNLHGYFTNVASATATGESSALATALQYTIWGLDPANSANQIVSIYQSQVL